MNAIHVSTRVYTLLIWSTTAHRKKQTCQLVTDLMKRIDVVLVERGLSNAAFTLHGVSKSSDHVVFTLHDYLGFIQSLLCSHGPVTGGYTLHDFTIGRITNNPVWSSNYSQTHSRRDNARSRWSRVTVVWMQCKSLWIKASAKCINVNVNIMVTWTQSLTNTSAGTFL